MKRSLLAIGIGTGTALAIVAACTFPDVTFNDGTGGPETGTETSTPTQEAGTDAPTDTSIPDSMMLGDAEMPIDAASCDDATCDCDNDKYNDFNKRTLPQCDAGTSDAAAYDCDDLVQGRNPGITTPREGLTPDSGPGPAGDWNCNQKVELKVDTNLKCVAGILNCSNSKTDQHQDGDNAQGFLTTVKCGEKGIVYKCAFENGNCVSKPTSASDTTQACL